MIGYVTLGTHDLKRAAAFYDALLEEIGGARAFEAPKMVAWSTGPEKTLLAVILPYDDKDASVGNGVMVALRLLEPQERAPPMR